MLVLGAKLPYLVLKFTKLQAMAIPDFKWTMESGAGATTNENRRTAIVEGSWFYQFRCGPNPWMARYVYGFIFLITTFIAWAVRDYGHFALKEISALEGCQGVGECLGAEGVLRVSLGCSLFYFIMFISTVGTLKMYGPRDMWQSGWWYSKFLLWLALILVPFWFPPAIIQLYAEVAHFGAGVFLLIQLISVISFIGLINELFHTEKDAERCHVQEMFLATAAYVVSLLGIISMYIWYAPESSCLLNIFFISWTLVLLQLMTSVSLHPKVNAGILTPGLMGLYVVFLCWCAIRRHGLFALTVSGCVFLALIFCLNILTSIVFCSEPPGDHCNRNAEDTSNKTDWLTIITFIIAILALVIATFSTGIDSKCFQFRKDDPQEDDVPYGYGFFHFVFATGTMYFAMLLIGWNTSHPMKKWTIDVGWTSTWVRIVNEWLAVCVYGKLSSMDAHSTNNTEEETSRITYMRNSREVF
ncbi:Serine incorporator/TMS membrane protein [Dillenia turbinata]|uniref:Serine incorporator/TMS membrane protein n=1 Tax=Dillenia turbinata TaxID=194707 RepID=A0AAN8W996_9MAGN